MNCSALFFALILCKKKKDLKNDERENIAKIKKQMHWIENLIILIEKQQEIVFANVYLYM